MTKSEIIRRVQSILKPSRYEHSISVAHTAHRLAELCGADGEKAFLAGVLHDCAKCYPDDELYRKAKEFGISLDSVSLRNPKLLHAYVGAYEARDIYGVHDEEILDAIYYHTIGKADMSKLCAVLYISDAIEPLRTYPGVEELRALAEKSIDRAVLRYTEMSIRFLLDNGSYIHPNAIETRNFYLR